MSTDVHEGTLHVTRFAGPAAEGADRHRWQFTLPAGEDYVTLRRDEVRELAEHLAASARQPGESWAR